MIQIMNRRGRRVLTAVLAALFVLASSGPGDYVCLANPFYVEGEAPLKRSPGSVVTIEQDVPGLEASGEPGTSIQPLHPDQLIHPEETEEETGTIQGPVEHGPLLPDLRRMSIKSGKELLKGDTKAPRADEEKLPQADTSKQPEIQPAADTGDDDEEKPASKEKTVDLGINNVYGLKEEVPDGKNWCGQYATYAILKQHFGKDISFKDFYQEVNPAGIFSSPDDLVRYARKQGVPAGKHNNSTLSDLRAQLDAGNPVTILGTGSSGKIPHYIAVTGYTTDENGNIASLKVVDSCYMREIPVDEFKEMWGDPLGGMHSALGALGGYHNLMITYDGSSSFNFDCAFDDAVAGGITNLVAGWKNRSFTQITRAIPRLAGGLLGAIPTAIGRGVHWAGDKMSDWGRKKWNEGGFFNKVAGGASTVAGAVTKGVGTVVSSVGNAVSAVGNFLGSLW